jgi:hypothetical protein
MLAAVPEAVAVLDLGERRLAPGRAARGRARRLAERGLGAVLAARPRTPGVTWATWASGPPGPTRPAWRPRASPPPRVLRDLDGAGQDAAAVRRFLDDAARRAGEAGSGVVLAGSGPRPWRRSRAGPGGGARAAWSWRPSRRFWARRRGRHGHRPVTNWVANRWDASGAEPDLDAFLRLLLPEPARPGLLERLRGRGPIPAGPDFDRVLPPPPALLGNPAALADWRLAHWGTARPPLAPAVAREPGRVCLAFATAWSHPSGVVAALASGCRPASWSRAPTSSKATSTPGASA